MSYGEDRDKKTGLNAEHRDVPQHLENFVFLFHVNRRFRGESDHRFLLTSPVPYLILCFKNHIPSSKP